MEFRLPGRKMYIFTLTRIRKCDYLEVIYILPNIYIVYLGVKCIYIFFFFFDKNKEF